MKQFYKKALVSFFIIYFVGLQFFTVPQKAHTAIPLVLTPAISSYLGAALVAAGIIVTNQSELQTMTEIMWERLSSFNKNLITTVVQQQSYIPGTFIASVWDIVNSWYTSIITNLQPIILIPSVPMTTINVSIPHNVGQPFDSSANIVFQNWLTQRIANSSLTFNLSIHKLQENPHLETSGVHLSILGNLRFDALTFQRGTTRHFILQTTINTFGTGYFYWLYDSLGNLLLTNQNTVVMPLTANTLGVLYFQAPARTFLAQLSSHVRDGVFGKHVLNNPAVFTPKTIDVAHKNNLPNLKMNIPAVVAAGGAAAIFNWLLNRDFVSLQQETGVIQSAIPVADSLLGLTGIMSNILEGILAIPTSIARFFDLTIPVNFVPLQVAGSLFTTRFPFSIPWDIARAFQITSAAGQAKPVFDINFSSPLTGPVVMQIDLEDFDHLIQIQRQFLILLFIIGLAMLTPKILKV